MGKFLSRSVAFRLSLGLLMSFGAAQLRDFLALRLPSHQSLADRLIALALVLALGLFVLRPLFFHFAIGQSDLSKAPPPTSAPLRPTNSFNPHLPPPPHNP